MSLFRAIGRWFARLMGFKETERLSPPEPEWRSLLGRYRAARFQVREAATPDELEVAHFALLAAQADLQRYVRLVKQDRGLEVRPIAENHRLYREMCHRLNEGATTPIPPPSVTSDGG